MMAAVASTPSLAASPPVNPPLADVLVEMVQTAPGQAAVGFRITPDGAWSDLDGIWATRTHLDATRLAAARQAIDAVGTVTVPSARVTDAVGETTWRLGNAVYVVPDGVSVPALSSLYVTLQALPAAPSASSTWTVDGVAHEVPCSASFVPALVALTSRWTTASPVPLGTPLVYTGAPLLDLVWREDGKIVDRNVILTDGRVGAANASDVLEHRATMSGDQVGALHGALGVVNWQALCR